MVKRWHRLRPVPDSSPPLRVYTSYINGVLHPQAFPHGQFAASEMERELNTQFHAWLEMTAPGALEGGKVTGIRFADMVE